MLSQVTAEPMSPHTDAQAAAQTRFTPIPMGQLIDDHPRMRPVVVDGILRRGETANIIAAAKAGKSHLVVGLAWSVATGNPWLGHQVEQGRVLIIDNELHPETLGNRLHRIATEMQINYEEFAKNIDVVPLRGHDVDIHSLVSCLDGVDSRGYSLVIVDALYRTLPQGTSENDNASMMAVYNRLDYCAREWDTAIAVVHHASKGGQGDKALTDVGAGAGSISRAADTHIVIRPHEKDGLSVMECVTRSFPPPSAVSIRFDWPIWHEVSTDAVVKNPRGNDPAKQAKKDAVTRAKILAALPPVGEEIQQVQLIEEAKLSETVFRRIVMMILDDNEATVRRYTPKGKKRQLIYYSRVGDSECNSECNSDEKTELHPRVSGPGSAYVIAEQELLTGKSEVESISPETVANIEPVLDSHVDDETNETEPTTKRERGVV